MNLHWAGHRHRLRNSWLLCKGLRTVYPRRLHWTLSCALSLTAFTQCTLCSFRFFSCFAFLCPMHSTLGWLISIWGFIHSRRSHWSSSKWGCAVFVFSVVASCWEAPKQTLVPNMKSNNWDSKLSRWTHASTRTHFPAWPCWAALVSQMKRSMSISALVALHVKSLQSSDHTMKFWQLNL